MIGADGANSFVREQAFIDFDVLDYRQAGLTCAIRTQPHQHVARQIFLETWPRLDGKFTSQQEGITVDRLDFA